MREPAFAAKSLLVVIRAVEDVTARSGFRFAPPDRAQAFSACQPHNVADIQRPASTVHVRVVEVRILDKDLIADPDKRCGVPNGPASLVP